MVKKWSIICNKKKLIDWKIQTRYGIIAITFCFLLICSHFCLLYFPYIENLECDKVTFFVTCHAWPFIHGRNQGPIIGDFEAKLDLFLQKAQYSSFHGPVLQCSNCSKSWEVSHYCQQILPQSICTRPELPPPMFAEI